MSTRDLTSNHGLRRFEQRKERWVSVEVSLTLVSLMNGMRLLITDPRAFKRRLEQRFLRTGRFVIRDEFKQQYDRSGPEWLWYHKYELMKQKRASWMGVPALKNALDAWVYQEILYEVRPDVLVEIGSYAGGSTLYCAHLFDILGHGVVVSVDKDRQYYNVRHPRVVEVTGDCGSPDVVQAVATIVGKQEALIVHDGPHDCQSVLRDLRAYGRLVSVWSYFIVEDSVGDVFVSGMEISNLKAGPLAAVRIFLTERTDYVMDRDRELYRLTYNPCGFLKRIF